MKAHPDCKTCEKRDTCMIPDGQDQSKPGHGHCANYPVNHKVCRCGFPPRLTVRGVFKRWWWALYRLTFTTEMMCGCRYDHLQHKIRWHSARCMFIGIRGRAPRVPE